MNTLRYKDYIGSVDFSETDNVFFGKIEGIGALVNYEGDSVEELRNAFKEAVDDYLIFCEDEGVIPEKSFSGKLDLDITPDLQMNVATLAKKAGMSINAFVRNVLERHVAAML
ncbi:MAG: type II toxin-antitoxin system HicB family antitoxin [Muribaculum sp.]|nr:type II toxin-antitoxin system HicB family antitoxin [Muribaculum sp.]